MVEMTSRERVLAALNHEEPDRVPLDIGGGATTTIVVEGYDRLKESLDIRSETKILNKVFRLARVEESVRKKLGSECIPLSIKPPVNWSPPPTEPGTFTDIWGITWREVFYRDDCYYYEVMKSPMAEAVLEDIERYPWPDPLDPGYTMGLSEDVKELYQETDYAIVADGGFKSFWELGYMLRGYDRLLMDLVENPDFVTALMNKLLEINISGTGRFLNAVGPYIQVFRTADDIAIQSGLLMSPAMYRRFIKPLYKKYYDFIRSKTEAKIFYHSCGNVVELLDDFIENGLDIINPIQVSAMGDTAKLKKRFGDTLAFWGAIDTQHVLPKGSPDDVEQEVKRRIHDLGQGGGYVVAAVHNIQQDVPPANILAMVNATRKHGRYPIGT
ncbi:MAG: hypothetical protein JW976_11310 [Syntrophaceae bacterium]|nr:hypothetical protein [Syntrophaceae bacterium]